MKLSKLVLVGASLLIAAPSWADMKTIYVGFEDTNGGDYDYNDLIFAITGNNLTVNSPGTWQFAPTVNDTPGPFWDNLSANGAGKNVGFCVFGGGSCNSGGVIPALSFPEYLAMSDGSAANSVTFTVIGSPGDQDDLHTGVQVTLGPSAARFGWYQGVAGILLANSLASAGGGTFEFIIAPYTPFGVWGCVNGSTNPCAGNSFGSQTGIAGDGTVGGSHLAFFREGSERITITHVPEPASVLLFGPVGLLTAFALRRRFAKK